jgi:hypothetical protein
MSDQDPCKCGHAMSFHRHDDDLLQMECGANPDCGHFSCRFPWTPTDFAPRPACDCKNWRAPVEPVPTLNDSKDLTVELSDRPVPAPRLEWAHNDGDTHEAQTEDVVWEIGACKAGQIEWYSLDLMIRTESVGAALALAEKLNAVLSPPVGTQPKGD